MPKRGRAFGGGILVGGLSGARLPEGTAARVAERVALRIAEGGAGRRAGEPVNAPRACGGTRLGAQRHIGPALIGDPGGIQEHMPGENREIEGRGAQWYGGELELVHQPLG